VAAARSVGDWLLLDTYGFQDELRVINVGSKIAKEIECSGK